MVWGAMLGFLIGVELRKKGVAKSMPELRHDKVLDEILVAYSDEEIERQWQRVETSLTILRNLHIERANMEFWSRFEMVTKGMKP
jgi:hypothetical protein